MTSYSDREHERSDLRQAYELGRRDAKRARKRHPVLMTFTIIAAIGAVSGDVGVGTGAAVGAGVGAVAGAVKGCREDGGCGASSPNRRQYYDERAGRYYYYDPGTGRYYWENGTPR